jgi:hypothetical protein
MIPRPDPTPTPPLAETQRTARDSSGSEKQAKRDLPILSLDNARARGLRLLREMTRIQCQELPPACGLQFPTSDYVERSITPQINHGDPLIPSPQAIASRALGKMAGTLTGVPGSGRSSFLMHLAYQWAVTLEQDANAPIVCYFTARDYLVYAKSPVSVSRFIADAVSDFSGDDEAALALVEELETRNAEGALHLLLDDLDRLTEPEQAIVLDQLSLSPAVLYATAPWDADRVMRKIRRFHPTQFRLDDLDERAQRRMLEQCFAKVENGIESEFPGGESVWPAPEFLSEARQRPFVPMDMTLKSRLPQAYLALENTPDLAALPVGMTAICSQAVRQITAPAAIAHCMLGELLERVGVPPTPSHVRWPPDNPFHASVLHAAAVVGHALNILLGHHAGNPNPDLTISRQQYEALAPEEWEGRWELLSPTRLFEPATDAKGEALRFYNRDLMCYLVAAAIQAGHLELDPSPNERALDAILFPRIRSYQKAPQFKEDRAKTDEGGTPLRREIDGSSRIKGGGH